MLNPLAKSYLNSALQYDPSNHMIYRVFGQLAHSTGELQHAIHYFTLAIQSNNYDYPSRLVLGYIYHTLEQFQEALDQLSIVREQLNDLPV